MIVTLDENGKIQLTAKAYMISTFRLLYDSFSDKELAMSYFAFMYYMYNFDSEFLRNYEQEQKRMAEVKKFIHRGAEIKVTRIVRRAMSTYKKLSIDNATSMYLVMRKNVLKLKEYASKMTLFDPSVSDDTDNTDDTAADIPIAGKDYVVVDSKEFSTINSLLPKQQEELDKFETQLLQAVKSRIDIYGGGSLGAYE